MTDEHVLEVRNLKDLSPPRTGNDHRLRRPSLSACTGQFTILVGASGSGS